MKVFCFSSSCVLPQIEQINKKMPNSAYKKPTAEQFGEIVSAAGGNLSSVARSLGVARSTISEWIRTDPDFRQVLKDERSKLFDEALQTARVVAMGIPAYEVDDQGKKKLAGWIERPSERMLQFFLDKFSDEDGFGDNDGTSVINGVSIKAWIMKENSKEG